MILASNRQRNITLGGLHKHTISNSFGILLHRIIHLSCISYRFVQIKIDSTVIKLVKDP